MKKSLSLIVIFILLLAPNIVTLNLGFNRENSSNFLTLGEAQYQIDLLWVSSSGGAGLDTLSNLWFDEANDVFYTSSCDQLTSDSGYNATLTQFSHSGNVNWELRLKNDNWSGLYDVITDSNGDIYVVSYSGEPDYSFVITKLNANQSTIWNATTNGETPDDIHSVKLAIEPTETYLYMAYHDDAKVAVSCFSTGNGTKLWTDYIDLKFDYDVTNWMAIDPSGDYMYICGGTRSAARLEENAIGDAFLVKCSIGSYGISVVWIAYYGDNSQTVNHEEFESLVYDSGTDKVYVTGVTESDGAGHEDIVIACYNASNGNLVWLKTWGGAANDAGHGITASGDKLYITGSTLSFVTNSYKDLVLACYDKTGNQLWNTTWDGDSHLNDEGCAVVAESDNSDTKIYVGANINQLGGGGDIAILCFSETKLDTTGPYISGASAINVNAGTYNSISWSVGDENWPGSYKILQNGTEVGFGDIEYNTTITYTLGYLFAGTYNFTIICYDALNNPSSFTTMVHVLEVADNTPPDIQPPEDVTIIEGETIQLSWWIGDKLLPLGYEIWHNDSLYMNGKLNANNTVTINILLSQVGVHNFTLKAWDGQYNTNTSTILVTVQEKPDTTPPYISSPDDIHYLVGTTGHNIVWWVEDLHPYQIKIYRNGTLISEIAWETNTSVTVNVDGLEVGIYNYTLVAIDSRGNTASDTVFVYVHSELPDNTPPDINHPPDIVIEVGEIGKNIEWTFGDKNPGTYEIYKNGELIIQSNWDHNTTVGVSLDNLDVGTYNFTIVVKDAYSNTATDTVIVTVVERADHNPPVIESPGDQTIFIGESVVLSWTIRDESSFTYLLYVDDDKNNTVLSGYADQYTVISTTIDATELGVGTHHYTLVAEDAYGNVATNTITITVMERESTPETTAQNTVSIPASTLSSYIGLIVLSLLLARISKKLRYRKEK